MGFENPLVGGIALRKPAIRSPNFVSGSTGWTINVDGSAEFNSIVIRGGTVVGGTALYYSGTPAAGNLIASISDTAGTDSFGNPFVAGVAAYSNSLSGDIRLHNGELEMGRASAGFAAGAAIFQSLTLGGDVQLNTGTGDSNHLDALRAAFTSGKSGQTTGSANAPAFSMIDTALSSDVDFLLSGSTIKTNQSGTPYTWQTPAYNTNWQSATTFNGNVNYHELQYRLDAENNLHIIGSFAAGAVLPANPVFTLPVGYRPSAAQALWAQRNNAGTVTSGHLYVGSSGDVMVITGSGLGRAVNNEYVCSGVIPLNNIP